MAVSLDTVSARRPRPWPPFSGPAPAMPPESRLEMPTQSLRRWSRARGAQAASPAISTGPVARAPLRVRRRARADRLRRLRDVPGRVGEPHDRPAVAPARALHDQLLVDRARLHERAPRLLPCSCAGRAPPRRCPPRSQSRTAIVMPVYNELTARTFAALEAIRESVEATGLGRAFRLFHPLRFRPTRTPGSRRSAPSSRCASASARNRGSTTGTGPRTITARPATSPISSPAGAGTTSTCSCSTPTA